MRQLFVAVVLFGTYCAFGMAWMGVVPLFPELTSTLQIERSGAALLVSIISMAKSVVPILAGLWAARVGLTTPLRTAGALICVSVLVPFLPSFPAWLLGRFLFGVGGAIWVTLMGAVVLQVIDKDRRGLANAANGVAVNAGVVIALNVTLPLKELLGWQGALVVYGALCGVAVLGLVLLGPLGQKPQHVPPLKDTLIGYVAVLKLPVTWFISLAFMGPLALYLVLNTFLPGHFETAFSLPKATTLRWIALMNLFGIPASLFAGALLRKTGEKPLLIVSALALPLACMGAVLVDSESARFVLLAVTGAAMFLPVSPLITLLQKQDGVTPVTVGMVLGTMFSVTYVLSALIPTAVGAGLDAGVPATTLFVASAFLGLTPLAALGLRTR
jgi:CP family cyanate transporter-like MFS transporter